jgi:hypothetical protein
VCQKSKTDRCAGSQQAPQKHFAFRLRLTPIARRLKAYPSTKSKRTKCLVNGAGLPDRCARLRRSAAAFAN